MPPFLRSLCLSHYLCPSLSLIQQLTSFPDTLSPPKSTTSGPPRPADSPSSLKNQTEISPPPKKAIPPFCPVAHSAPATRPERRWQRSARQEGLRPLFGLQYAAGRWAALVPASRHQWGSQQESRCWCFLPSWPSPRAAMLLTAPARLCAAGSWWTPSSLSVGTAASTSADHPAA